MRWPAHRAKKAPHQPRHLARPRHQPRGEKARKMSLTSGSTCIAEFCIMQVLISTDIWEVCSVLSDMKIFRVALLCSLVVSFSSASADQRFALVKIRKIYVELPSTALLEIEIGQDRNNIIKDQRAEQLREMLAELQVLRGE